MRGSHLCAEALSKYPKAGQGRKVTLSSRMMHHPAARLSLSRFFSLSPSLSLPPSRQPRPRDPNLNVTLRRLWKRKEPWRTHFLSTGMLIPSEEQHSEASDPLVAPLEMGLVSPSNPRSMGPSKRIEGPRASEPGLRHHGSWQAEEGRGNPPARKERARPLLERQGRPLNLRTPRPPSRRLMSSG